MTERERISLEEYRALTAAKPARRGSTGGWGGWPGPRVCRKCGGRVLASESAWMHTEGGVMWCEHLRTEDCEAREEQ